MKFLKTKIDGCHQVELNKIIDSGVFFSRMFCLKEYKKNKIKIKNFVLSSNSFSIKKDIFRGMHFQKKPYQDDKLVRCAKGEISDKDLNWQDLKINS